jgi:hypothetical protein
MAFLPLYLKGSPFIKNPIDLPTRWNTSDSNSNLQVIGDEGLKVLYIGIRNIFKQSFLFQSN